MVRIVKPVTPSEIADMLREAARLLELGPSATQVEREALRVRKIDLLERIAAHPGPYDDPAEAAEVARQASRDATALRNGHEPSWGEW